MPTNWGKGTVSRDAYCSAPPLTSTPLIFLPPHLPLRAEEGRRPRTPLAHRPRAPLFAIVKREVHESETDSAEFVVDERDAEDVKVEPKIEPDPRQLSARVAALAIRHPDYTASTSSEEAQGPRAIAYRTQPLCAIPSSQLGPAAPARKPGRPKGSKSKRRIPVTFGLPVPPVRQAAAKAQAEMSSSKNRS